MNRCNVQIRNNVSIDRNILSYLITLTVGNFLSVQFPWNFRCWITTSDTFQKDWWARMQCFFGEGLSNNWWIDWKKSIWLTEPTEEYGKMLSYICRPILIQHLLRHFLDHFVWNTGTCPYVLSLPIRSSKWHQCDRFSYHFLTMKQFWSDCLVMTKRQFQKRKLKILELKKLPEKWQVNTAGRPKSTTWDGGSILADNGAVTVNTVSTLSPPTELFTTHRYFPESSTTASLMMSVPDTCFTRSFKTTACLRVVPSMNLYHLRNRNFS